MERMENDSSTLPRDLSEVQAQAAAQIEAAREALGDVDRKVRGFVKENPGLCLLGAVAAGFVIGRIVSRR